MRVSKNWPNSFNLTTLGSRVYALSFSFPPILLPFLFFSPLHHLFVSSLSQICCVSSRRSVFMVRCSTMPVHQYLWTAQNIKKIIKVKKISKWFKIWLLRLARLSKISNIFVNRSVVTYFFFFFFEIYRPKEAKFLWAVNWYSFELNMKLSLWLSKKMWN